MTETVQAVCPICYSTVFRDFNKREKACCSGCGAMERGRLAWITLSRLGGLKRGIRFLNFAPEKFMLEIGQRVIGSGYEAADFSPELFGPSAPLVRRIDMCRDLGSLDQGGYDVVMHNHVLEHLPCHVPIVIQQLNKLLKPGGLHVFSMPIFPNRQTEEDLSPELSDADRTRRFGQSDHVRLFGRNYLDVLDEAGISSSLIDVRQIASEHELNTWRIPLEALDGASPHRIFVWERPVYP